MSDNTVQSGLVWVELLCWISGVSPRFAHSLRRPAVWGAWRAPELRQRLLQNAAVTLGPQSTKQEQVLLARNVLGSFYNFLVNLSTSQHLSQELIAQRTQDVEGIEHYLQARELGKGVIVTTAHMGDFETGIAALRAIESNVLVVFKRDELPLFERLRSEQRLRMGVIEAPVDDGLKTWLKLRDALNTNATVLMQADRSMPGQGGIPVEFMGTHLLAPVGPAKLSLATGAPILPVFSLRTSPRSVKICIENFIPPQESSSPATIKAVTQQITSIIERYVSQYPEQWLTLHNPWVNEDGTELCANGS